MTNRIRVTGRALITITAAAALLLSAGSTLAKTPIVASTTDLASIAANVGGDQVELTAICRPRGDPHRVEVLPSYMVKVSRARLYLKVGMGLDRWADDIVNGSHNGDLTVIDCSRGVNVLEKPSGKVNASMGDVHPDGNPHYWLDPMNAAVVANTIAAALATVDPAHAEGFHNRAEAFGREMTELAARLKAAGGALPNRTLLTYHKSWSYLESAMGLQILSTVEPVPGIPPTGKHLQELVTMVKERKVPVLLQEPYFSQDAGKFLARQADIRVVVQSASCADASAGAYVIHMNELMLALAGPPAPEGGVTPAGR